MTNLLLATLASLSLVSGSEVPQHVLAATHARVVDDKADVEAVVKSAVDKVMVVLQDASKDRLVKRKEVMAILEPLIDFKLLAMLSLGKTHWTNASDAQREAFVALFTDTLKLSYFEKLELFTDEEVEFEEAKLSSPPNKSPKYFMVTYIISKGDRIQLAYELAKRDGGWKVYDVEIEGVSIRKSYNSQYEDYLKSNSFDDLLALMKTKVEEAREKDSKRTD